MTELEFVARCREYTDKATPGPWTFCNLNPTDDLLTLVIEEDGQDPQPILRFDGEIGFAEIEANWDFVRESRTDLPAALSLIEQLVKERDEARAERDALKAGSTRTAPGNAINMVMKD